MSAHSIPEPPVSFALPKVSVREYLSRERLSEKRHEYVDGEIIAMSGETPAHNQIAGNLYRQLGNRFEERPCEVYFETVKARVMPTQYRYPDVMALCGEARFDAEHPPSLLNPSVIVEVLSPSTESFDSQWKVHGIPPDRCPRRLRSYCPRSAFSHSLCPPEPDTMDSDRIRCA